MCLMIFIDSDLHGTWRNIHARTRKTLDAIKF